MRRWSHFWPHFPGASLRMALTLTVVVERGSSDAVALRTSTLCLHLRETHRLCAHSSCHGLAVSVNSNKTALKDEDLLGRVMVNAELLDAATDCKHHATIQFGRWRNTVTDKSLSWSLLRAQEQLKFQSA